MRKLIEAFKRADPPILSTIAIGTILIVFLIGCAALQPGADPLVVRTEQAIQAGQGTLDLAINLDNLDRGFWTTNAPAFHNFCQWLRQPILVEGSNRVPREVGIFLQLDDVKINYKSAKASSNDLFVALATFQSVINQANAWTSLITNNTTSTALLTTPK